MDAERSIKPEHLSCCGPCGGDCGAVVSSIDWSQSPLGPIASWSPILRASVNLVLCSRHPMCLMWGRELVQIYNDGFVPSIRDRHPAAMGASFPECFPEVWTVIGRQVERAFRTATPSWHQDHLVPTRRGGRLEEVYWTYSYSPIFEQNGTVAGVLMAGTETTCRVLAERRMACLSALSDGLADVTTGAESAAVVVDVLGSSRLDFPFAIVYSVNGDAELQLVETNVRDDGALRAIDESVRRHYEDLCRKIDEEEETAELVELPPRITLSDAPWPEPLTHAFTALMPRPPAGRPNRLYVFGLSPRLPFDASYRCYVQHLVERIALTRARIAANEARIKVESERRDLLRQAPVPAALWSGEDVRIELANDAFLNFVRRDVIGKTFAEAFPELVGSDIERCLREAGRTGKAFSTDEGHMSLMCNGVLEDHWFKLAVQPLHHENGEVQAMMSVIVDITDSVQARRTLERCSSEREKLLSAVEAASRAKDEFLAMLGHELRNPLAPITTAVHLMKLKQPDALAREREIIARQATHLVHLVDDLLDVSRVARGKVRLNRTRVALGEVLARAVETASPLFEQKRHVLSVHVPGEPVDVEGDMLRLEQVVANLLTNAAKYTEAGGRIWASVAREGEVAVVRVEDNGVGIAPEQVEQVFNAFFQGPRSRDRAEGGLGLGLALVKSFVSLHGGTVDARPREGGGSIFEVRLPALPDVEQETPRTEVEPTELEPAPSEKKKRVLVVDDSDDILELVCSFLRHQGFEVMAARDAPSALRLAPGFHPDVAVLDIGLPAMDGYELAQHLREDLGEAAPRMIAMTGYGQEADRERARLAGFAVHLVKPVDPKELLASVRG